MLKRIFTHYLRPIVAIVIVLLLVCFATINSFKTSSTMNIITRDELQNNWRTDYDLLIRPTTSEANTGDLSELVRRSDMGNIRGGITLEQYEIIKGIEGVLVAAPISFIGYISSNIFEFSFDFDEEGFYVTEQSVKIFDGIRYRDYIKDNGGRVTQYKKDAESIENQIDFIRNGGWVTTSGSMGIPGRDNYFWSLIAVDPIAEAKLLHLDQAIIEGEYLPNLNQLLETRGMPLIPILLQKKSFDVLTSYTISKVDLDPQISRDEIMALGGEEYIKQLPREQVFHIEYNPYSDDLLYYYGRIDIEEGQLVKLDDRMTKILGTPFLYELGEVEFKQAGDLEGFPLLEATAIGHQGEQIYYRSLESSLFDKPFGFDLYGIFDSNLLVNPYVTSDQPKSPDYYNPDIVYFTHDVKGNPIDQRVEYRNSPYKNTYSTGGVDAITTLEGAKFFLGDAPISIIRVIVDGVGERSVKNMEKVEKVAAEIREKTGLNVDVMIGAADRKVQVFLDDYEGVPGYGYILEGWSQAGASFAISERVSSTNIFLLVFVLFVGWISLSLIYRNYVEVRKKEIYICYTVGWSKRAIIKLLLKESCIVFMAVLTILLITKFMIGEYWSWEQFNDGLLCFIVFALLSNVFLFILPLLRDIEQNKNLRSFGESIANIWTKSSMKTMWGYLYRNLLRYPIRTLLKFCILSLTQIYIILFLLVKQSSSSFLILTFLGEGIDLLLEPYQWFIFYIGLFLSVSGYMGILVNQYVKRSQEVQLYRVWGWNSKKYYRLFLLEEIITSFLAICIGLGIGYFITRYVIEVDLTGMAYIGMFVGSLIISAVIALIIARVVPNKQLSLKMFV